MAYNEEEKRQLIEDFDSETIVADGIVRWQSNNHVPPDEVLQVWIAAGKQFDLDGSVKQREADSLVYLEQYRKSRVNRSPEQIAEEQFEMRAAFGPGVTVVNVITGEVHETEDSSYRLHN